MARKTKEDALLTRSAILDAAEHLFQAQGVAGTSLHDIALAAGVTRGAVYWHFTDKSDLFNAMLGRVVLPMESATAALDGAGGTPPLDELRAHLLGLLRRVVDDEQVRRVFEVSMQKVEYVDETTKVREHHVELRRNFVTMLERTLRRGQALGQVVARPGARPLAIGLHALLHGLIHSWMLDPGGFDLVRVGRGALDLHLRALAVPPTA